VKKFDCGCIDKSKDFIVVVGEERHLQGSRFTENALPPPTIEED